jgi:hypothetical protein
MTIANKHNYGGSNPFDGSTKFDNIPTGKVVSITDEYDGNRIKVRIKGIDDKISDTDLPYAFPLLPKFINLIPAVGESVFVFLVTEDNKYDNRMYIGPIISQPQKLKFDPHYYSSASLLSSGVLSPEKAPSTLPDAKGVYPDKKYFAIQGRDNSDIIFKEREILLRAGKFETNNNLKFNKKNIGYIQIKHDANFTTDKKSVGTVTNVVSDRIHLLTHNGTPRFILDDQTDLITDTELEKIIKNTQSMVYGELLVELISLIKNFIINHSHPYHGLPPVQDQNLQDIQRFNLNSLLSQYIRIN